MKVKRVLSLALALVMVLGLLPMTALGDMGGNYLEGENDEGSGWRWDAATRTLTLNGYAGPAFEANGDLIVELANGSSNYVRGRLQGGHITVRGTGSLVINGNEYSGMECLSLNMESGRLEIKNCGFEDYFVDDEPVKRRKSPILFLMEPGGDSAERALTMTGGTLVVPKLGTDTVSITGGEVIFVGDIVGRTGELLGATNLVLHDCVLTVQTKGIQYGRCGSAGTLSVDNVRIFRATDPGQTDGDCFTIRAREQPMVANMDPKVCWATEIPGPAGLWDLTIRSDGVPTAYPSAQMVEVDGEKVEFQCYALKDAAGNDTNYIKLRDLANILNSTAAQFQVGWDGNVTITTRTAYTPNGTEQTTPFSGQREYQLVTGQTMVDGKARDLSAFTLADDNGGGYTYYKLRDLGAALGVKVDWSAQRGIFIETK